MDTSHEDSPSAANRRPSCYHDENTQKGYMGVAAPRNAASNRNYQGSAYGLEAATERLVSTTRVPRAESSHAPETRLPSALQHNLGPASLQRPLYEGVSGRPGKQYANFGPVHPNSTTQAHPPVAYMAPSTGLGVFHPASGPEVHTPHGPGVTVSFGPRPSLGGGAAVGIGVTQSPPTPPTQPAPLTPTTGPTGDYGGYRICSKQCHRNLQPPSAFKCSSEPYGPLETFKHCTECIRKYRRHRMDLAAFREWYVNPNPERHAQWLAEEARQRANVHAATD